VREEARAIIKRVCNANEDHALIFNGTGATSAINLFISKLKLKQICEQIKIKKMVEGFESEIDRQTVLSKLTEGAPSEEEKSDELSQ